MATTFTKIASNTVGVLGVSSVTFSSIPSTYTDLCLKASVNGLTLASLAVSFNGSTSNFTNKWLEGNGATAASGSNAASGRFIGLPSTATSVFSNIEFYIPNYGSANYKSYSSDSVTEANATTAYADLIAGLWSDTSAINSIAISGTTLTQYSTFTLYGIKNS